MVTATSLDKEKIRILLLESIHKSGVDAFHAAGYTNIDYQERALAERDLIEHIRGAHIVGIRSRTDLTADVLGRAEKLIAIGCFGIGTDQVDLSAAEARGVPVFNAPFSNTRSVAELILSEVIALARQLGDRSSEVHRGQWRKVALGCYEVRGKTLGIVGLGHVGRHVAKTANAFEMHVLAWGPRLTDAAAQAAVDNTRANQRLIYAELEKGTDPVQIIELLERDPDFDSRQFEILDMQGRHAGASGSKNQASSLHQQGQIAGTGIWYSIQGNILTSDDVVHMAAAAFTSEKGSLTDRVMAAMEAADRKGGDKRCTCDSEPKVDAPCTTKTAHVSYILRAEKTDRNRQSFNDGDYAMYLSVTNEDIKPTENANPVKTLRMRYDAWKKSHGG